MAYDVALFANRFPSIPEEFRGQLAEVFGNQYDQTFTRLSIKGNRFALKGAQEREFNEPSLNVIILGEAQEPHCIYYSNSYTTETEDQKPTAVWMKSQPIPAVVPANKRQKDEQGRNGYFTRQRIVLAIVSATGADIIQPVVFDVNAMSLFGEDLKASGAMSYAHFRQFCAANKLLPCQIPVQLVFDRSQSVPVVKFIPARNPDQSVAVFDPAQQMEIFKMAVDPAARELLKISVIDGTQQDESQTAPVPPQTTAVPPQTTAVPPQPEPVPPQTAAVPPQTTAVPPQPEPVPQPQPKPQAKPVQGVVGNASDVVDAADKALTDLINAVNL